MDHRHVRQTRLHHNARLDRAQGHRADVLRLQIARLGSKRSQLRAPERLGRLLLVMSLPLFFAVSTGLNDSNTNPTVDEKKTVTSAEKPEPGRVAMVHPWRPLHRRTHIVLLADTKTMDIRVN